MDKDKRRERKEILMLGHFVKYAVSSSGHYFFDCEDLGILRMHYDRGWIPTWILIEEDPTKEYE